MQNIKFKSFLDNIYREEHSSKQISILKYEEIINKKIDIIFSDPPYSKTDVNEIAINNLIKNSWMNDSVYIFLETSSRLPIKSISGFEVLDKRKIGDSLLTIYLSSSY